MNQDALFLVGIITAKCALLSVKETHYFWVDFSAHVQKFRVHGCKKDEFDHSVSTLFKYDCEVYLDGEEENMLYQLRNILKYLEECEREQSFKIPADGKNQYVVSATTFNSTDGEGSKGNSYALGADDIFV